MIKRGTKKEKRNKVMEGEIENEKGGGKKEKKERKGNKVIIRKVGEKQKCKSGT